MCNKIASPDSDALRDSLRELENPEYFFEYILAGRRIYWKKGTGEVNGLF